MSEMIVPTRILDLRELRVEFDGHVAAGNVKPDAGD